MNVIRLNKTDSSESVSPRPIPGFDVLRAFAALAVVALHAGVPYLKHPMPGLVWPVEDTGSHVVDAIFWSIEVMIMPLFLMIAGFLMWRSSRRLTPGQLVQSRARRLLAPLAFGIVIVLPIDLYIWTVGLVAQGTVPVVKLKSFAFDPPISDQIWGLSHLWFLLYVFLYVVVAACLIRIAVYRPVYRPVYRFVQHWITPIMRPTVLIAILSSVAVAILVAAPEVVWGFQHAILPVPSKWIYSGVFFAAGCLLALHDAELTWASRMTPRILVLSVVLLTTSVILGTWSLGQSPSGPRPNTAATFLLAVLTVAAASTTTIGLIGASARYVGRVSNPVRYVASASFWIYLIHHPLLGLIHFDIKTHWPAGSPIVKLCVSFVAATAVSLLLYESLVRRSWFGTLLGFSHSAKRESAGDNIEASEILKLPAAEPGHRRRAA